MAKRSSQTQLIDVAVLVIIAALAAPLACSGRVETSSVPPGASGAGDIGAAGKPSIAGGAQTCDPIVNYCDGSGPYFQTDGTADDPSVWGDGAIAVDGGGYDCSNYDNKYYDGGIGDPNYCELCDCPELDGGPFLDGRPFEDVDGAGYEDGRSP